jgi:hypothetical protein
MMTLAATVKRELHTATFTALAEVRQSWYSRFCPPNWNAMLDRSPFIAVEEMVRTNV